LYDLWYFALRMGGLFFNRRWSMVIVFSVIANTVLRTVGLGGFAGCCMICLLCARCKDFSVQIGEKIRIRYRG
jgi:hypothetical protein